MGWEQNKSIKTQAGVGQKIDELSPSDNKTWKQISKTRNSSSFSSLSFPAQNMRAFSSSCNLELTFGFLSISRFPPSIPRKVFLTRAKFVDSRIDGLSSSRVAPPGPLEAKNETKAVLTLFLKKQGVSNDVAAKTINKSDLFIDHLLSRLHFVHEEPELTTAEIKDAVVTYLESLLKEHGNNLVEIVEKLTKSPAAPVSSSHSALDYKKLKAVSRVIEAGPAGQLPPHILYLIELGMDLEQIKGMTRRFPSFACYSLEGKIKPVVEFLLDLGVSKSDVQSILTRRPKLCGISLKENLIPTMLS